MKKSVKIILIVLSILIVIILLDTIQAKIFNNKPILKVVEDYNGGDLYQKHKGILVDTYIHTDNSKKTVFKWEKYSYHSMNLENSNIEIELFMDGKTIEISKQQDIEFITNLLENSKYVNELCNGINTHKIKIGNEIYYLKESCAEIQKGKKQAIISNSDLTQLLKIIEDNK